MDRTNRLRRLKFRAWHRGTREADYIVGCFFDSHAAGWSDEQLDWFEALLDEQDVDILAWAMGTQPPPAHLDGPAMAALCRLDYVNIPR